VVVNDQTWHGVTNIGYNPTFGDDALTVETHLLDFSEDIVGKTIKIKFVKRLRDEETFGDVKELSDQITRDIEQARELLQNPEKD
jgi:riboflavin kinase/FMN adenylyltransferase